jgi:hypothetical protein
MATSSQRTHYDPAILNYHLKRDMETFKEQKARLYRLQQHPEEVELKHRYMIINWSRDAIKDYADHIEWLESKDDPTKEDKKCMNELNTLLLVGDELGEITRSFAEVYQAKFGSIKIEAGALPEGVQIGKGATSTETTKPLVATDAPSTPSAEMEAKGSTEATSTQTAEPASEPEQIASAEVTETAIATSTEVANPTDPKGVYTLLEIPPTAPMEDLSR